VLVTSIEALCNEICGTDQQFSAAAETALAGVICSWLLINATSAAASLTTCTSAACRTALVDRQSIRSCLWKWQEFCCKET
jgi:hypothetical protein